MFARILFIIIAVIFGAIASNALFVLHHDVDLVGVMATSLGLSIKTFGWVCATISLIFGVFALRTFRF